MLWNLRVRGHYFKGLFIFHTPPEHRTLFKNTCIALTSFIYVVLVSQKWSVSIYTKKGQILLEKRSKLFQQISSFQF